MPVEIEQLANEQQWRQRFDSMITSLDEVTRNVPISVSLTPVEGSGLESMAEEFTMELVNVIKEFMLAEVVAHVLNEYRQKSGNFAEYSPQWYALGNGNEGYEDVYDGFRALDPYMQALEVSARDGMVTATLGEGVYDLRSQNYGWNIPSATQLTTWFLNVEAGTGIAENVGGNVRTSGATKMQSPPGAWFLGREDSENTYTRGVVFTGQKGFHMFWDPNTERPLPYWQKIFAERLPEFVGKRMQRFIRNRTR